MLYHYTRRLLAALGLALLCPYVALAQSLPIGGQPPVAVIDPHKARIDHIFGSLDHFSYVSTVSALDVDAPLTEAVAYDVYTAGSNPANPSRFDNFLTQWALDNQEDNTRHTLYTPEHAEWVFNEMEGNPQNPNCTYRCAGVAITGPNLTCSSGGTYQISNLPPGVQVTWSTSPANVLSPATATGPVYNVASVNSTNNVTLEAEIEGDCGQLTITRTLSSVVAQPAFPTCNAAEIGSCGSYQVGVAYTFVSNTNLNSGESLQ